MTLACEVTTPNLPAVWYKDGAVLAPSDVCEIAQEGRSHRLTFQNVALDDEAEYTCKVNGKSTTAVLLVDGRWRLCASVSASLI